MFGGYNTYEYDSQNEIFNSFPQRLTPPVSFGDLEYDSQNEIFNSIPQRLTPPVPIVMMDFGDLGYDTFSSSLVGKSYLKIIPVANETPAFLGIYQPSVCTLSDGRIFHFTTTTTSQLRH